MRVLIINKFLYPNGGSETYIFKLGEALEQHGHEVQYFGMEHEGRCVGNRVNAYTSGMIGSKHSLHLYLYSPFVACVFSLLQMILFQTTRHQEVITVVVVLGTTWLVMQGWFIRAIEKLKIA